jgi:fructose-1-phosphate kinase PfkB-like protein
MALGCIGGVSGALLDTLLSSEGVPHAFETVPGFTRINVMIYEASSKQRTRLYLPGLALGGEQVERIEDRLRDAKPGSIVVIGGSLPPGLPSDTYGTLIAWLNARGLRCEGAWKARPPHVEASTAVGSGDSMVAGFAMALCDGGSLIDALTMGTAAGAATSIRPGTSLCSAEDVRRILPGVTCDPLRRTPRSAACP